MVEDLGVRPPDGGQAAADDARPRPPHHAAPAAAHAVQRVGGGKSTHPVKDASEMSWKAFENKGHTVL